MLNILLGVIFFVCAAILAAFVWFEFVRPRLEGGEQQNDQVTEGQEQEQFAQKDRVNKKIFWSCVILGHLLLFMPSFWARPILTYGDVKLEWFHLALFFAIIYNRFSFKTQGADEVGAKFVFKAWCYQTTPGLIYIPRWIVTHVPNSALLKQWEIPQDLSDRYPNETTLRMTTAPSRGGVNSEDPLATGRLTLEGTVIVSARLDKGPGGYRQFIERIGNIDNFLQITDDEVVRRLRQQVIEKTPSEVFVEWENMEKAAIEHLKEKIGSFGFAELSIGVKGFDLPKRVNEALADRTAAHVNVETRRLDGEASKQFDTLVAKGKEALKQAELDGTIKALVNAKDKLNVTQEQAIFLAYQEVIATALKNAQYTLLPQGQGGMLDPAIMMSIMQEAIKASNRTNGGTQ